MTPEQAIAAQRARWDHPPPDLADVAERVAARLSDADDIESTVLSNGDAAVRVFVRRQGATAWRSAYVHHPAEVDAVLSRLCSEYSRDGSAPAGADRPALPSPPTEPSAGPLLRERSPQEDQHAR